MPTHCYLGASSCGLSPCTAPFPPGTRLGLARLGRFGKLLVQMRTDFAGTRCPRQEGREPWAQAEGLALTWPVGQELKCWSPPGRPSLPGPLSGGLCAPRPGGHPHPSSDPLGAAGAPPVGPLLRLGWELPPLVQATACLRVPCGWGLCQLQAPTVHPEEPGPAPARPTETTWRGCNRHGSGETGETVSGWQGRQPDRWTDGTSQPPLHGSRGQRAPGETEQLGVTVRWGGRLRCEEPRTGRLWAPRAPGAAPRRRG